MALQTAEQELQMYNEIKCKQLLDKAQLVGTTTTFQICSDCAHRDQ